MSTDEDKTQGVVSETAKALGINAVIPEMYRDLLQPAAQEVGSQLLIVAKAVKIALAPLKVTVWSFERLSEWLQVRLTTHFANTPADQIVAPKPEIAGPLLLHLHFLKDEEELRSLFSNLLAAAMDRETRNSVHPAYVSILQQLTPDEALILRHLNNLEREAARRAEKERRDAEKKRRDAEKERRQRSAAEPISSGNPLRSFAACMLNLTIVSSGRWFLSEVSPGNHHEKSLEHQFSEFCAEAGAHNIDQSEAYLDNLIRLRILICDLHSTAELEPEGANRYGDWAAHIREGSYRELFLSEFGRGLVRSVCHDGGNRNAAEQHT